MMRPVGVGFQSPGPTGVVGLTMTTGWPLPRRFQSLLLSKEFRALVVPDHVLRVQVGFFVGQFPGVGRDERSHAAGVNEAVNSGLAGGGKQVARAGDVALVDFLGIFRPKPVVGGNMVNALHALQRGGEGIGIAQIRVSELYRKPLQRAHVTLRANQHPNLFTLLD